MTFCPPENDLCRQTLSLRARYNARASFGTDCGTRSVWTRILGQATAVLREISKFSKMATARQPKDFCEFGPYRVDLSVRVLLRDGAIVRLTPKVFDTLMTLVQRAGQPVSKEDLLRSVWPDTFVEESNLAQNISVLRKALGAMPDGSPYIETIAKRGY